MNISKRTSPIWKMSKEQFVEIIKNGKSITEILSHFGLKNKGSNHITLKNRINHEGLDLSHVYENIRLSNKRNRFFTIRKKSIKPFLVENSNSNNRGHLKKKLISENLLKEECVKCGIKNEWNGQKLSLVLDHINGISNDNRLENLRFLCPNCNSQTSTFAGRNVKHNKCFCTKCNKKISKKNKSKLCYTCYHLEVFDFKKYQVSEKILKKEIIKNPLSKRRVTWPSKEILEKLIWEKPTTHIANEYEVSDKAVEKWCKYYDIKKPPRGYWTKK